MAEMPDLLLELFSEEIPARMQTQAAKDLERLVVGALSDRGLLFEGVKAFAGPRRLTLAVAGLPAKQPDVSEEKKGPRVGAPEKAVEGFLRSAGVKLEQCERRDDGKGEFYVAVIARKGRATEIVLAEIIPQTIAKLTWPKSMRWGPRFVIPGVNTWGTTTWGAIPDDIRATPVQWVRPLRSIICTFGGEIVPFEFAEIKSGNVTLGHRFLSSGAITARHFDEYVEKLRKAHVIVDAAERQEIILHEARQKAFALGLELIEDEGLLEEVAGLNEWPVVLVGHIEDQFMDLPPEILQTSMRTHQKYFSLRDAKTGRLANRFAVVSNMVSTDGGKQIVAGNERVLRARLSDAKFFWDQDRQHALESRVEALKGIVFHAKLGTQYERVERIEALAGEIAAKIGADVTKAKRAARLCKADLTTGVVGEFPELQGIMGSYYAAHDGEDAEVVAAIRDHYKPLGPTDTVPAAPVSIAVALAEKVDVLGSFWAINEKPTGSGDPYALRRAALGLVRILLQNELRLEFFPLTLTPILRQTVRPFIYGRVAEISQLASKAAALGRPDLEEYISEHFTDPDNMEIPGLKETTLGAISSAKGLGDFVADRLKVALKEKGTRHDLIDAVFSLGNEDDLVRLVARVEALQDFLATKDGADLLVAYRRAANILKIEEKKDKASYDGDPDPDALVLPEEKALFVELATAAEVVRAEIARERFVEAMGVMSRLRQPVDAFFDKVTVNDKDPALRRNRLLLLSRLRATLHLAADFSRIEG
jgi:glycyl-tRNA synthetase beta chain